MKVDACKNDKFAIEVMNSGKCGRIEYPEIEEEEDSEGVQDLYPGDELVLECHSTGFPEPESECTATSYPALSHSIPLYCAISCYIPQYPAISCNDPKFPKCPMILPLPSYYIKQDRKIRSKQCNWLLKFPPVSKKANYITFTFTKPSPTPSPVSNNPQNTLSPINPFSLQSYGTEERRR